MQLGWCMKTIITIIFATLLLGGCVLHTHGHSHSYASRRAKKCAPSHHWNGSYCEHNGRGRGARKHDY